MKLYFELLKYPVFTMEHVSQYYDNIESARSAVKRLTKGGLAVKITFTHALVEKRMLHWRTVIKLQARSHLPRIFLIIRQWNIMELVTRFFMRFMYLQIRCFEILNLMDTHFAMYVLNVMRESKQ